MGLIVVKWRAVFEVLRRGYSPCASQEADGGSWKPSQSVPCHPRITPLS
jgi:hypothetical protein